MTTDYYSLNKQNGLKAEGSENGTLELSVLMELQGVSKHMKLLKRLSFLTEMTHESDFAQGDRWDVEL